MYTNRCILEVVLVSRWARQPTASLQIKKYQELQNTSKCNRVTTKTWVSERLVIRRAEVAALVHPTRVCGERLKSAFVYLQEQQQAKATQPKCDAAGVEEYIDDLLHPISDRVFR